MVYAYLVRVYPLCFRYILTAHKVSYSIKWWMTSNQVFFFYFSYVLFLSSFILSLSILSPPLTLLNHKRPTYCHSLPLYLSTGYYLIDISQKKIVIFNMPTGHLYQKIKIPTFNILCGDSVWILALVLDLLNEKYIWYL